MNVGSAFVAGAPLIRRPPHERLRPFVGCFWSLSCTPDTRIRSLPDGCATLSVELVEGRRPQSFLTGPRLAPGDLVPERQLTLLGVRLRPGVVFALTRIPAPELAGRREPLARWRAADAAQLEDGLGAAASNEERFDVLEAFVGARLTEMPVDARVMRAVQLLERCEGRVKIGDLAARCQISGRHLDRVFRRWVGLSPKVFARIMRFQASLDRLDPWSSPALAAMAHGQGYFDQSHLSNEFVRLAGLSPRRIASSRVADFSKTQCE